MKNRLYTISIIAAIGKNRELGKDNKLLWYIPEDLERFKKITLGHPVIMGRKTFQSIIDAIGKPLPQRKNIVITKNQSFTIEDAIVCHSIEEALEKAKELGHNEVFIIGGGSIYRQGMKYADKLYLTIVDGEYEADSFFPDYSEFTKVLKKKERGSGGYTYTFLELTK